MDTVK